MKAARWGVHCNRGHVGCWTVHRDWSAWAANALGGLFGLGLVLAIIALCCAGCGGRYPLAEAEQAAPPADADAGTCSVFGFTFQHCAAAPPPSNGQCPGSNVVNTCGGRVAVAYGQLFACGLCSSQEPLGCWDPSTLILCVASCDVCEVRP